MINLSFWAGVRFLLSLYYEKSQLLKCFAEPSLIQISTFGQARFFAEPLLRDVSALGHAFYNIEVRFA